MNKEFLIRGPGYNDENFIYSTWLKGLYYGCDWFKKIPHKEFFEKYRPVIKHLLSKSNVDVLCLAEDTEVIIGYSVYLDDTLHWVFIKKSWRKNGFSKLLLPDDIKRVTHLTNTAIKKRVLKKKEWTFNPFLA